VAGENIAVFGIFSTYSSVELAVDELRDSGFRNVDISVLLPQNIGSKDFAHKSATRALEGPTSGASAGAVLGGALGWLVGVGALAIPGLGPVIAAGPILATLGGVGVGGTFGGFAGALVSMGIPEYEAKRYEGRIKGGGILLSVHCDNFKWARLAKDILTRTSGQDISSTNEAGADFIKTHKPVLRAS
jgi:hypothetical protein